MVVWFGRAVSGEPGPIRTCIGCRKREPAAELLRIVARQGSVVVPDPVHRLPGRGAWLHPVSECLASAIRRRAFGRALGVSGNPDLSALAHQLDRNRHEHHEQTVKHQR